MPRKPKLDQILADAVDEARAALVEVTEEGELGEHVAAEATGERLVTHRFVSHKRGYRGWTWFATLARVPRAKSKDLTVCEVGIIPGEDALLAPAWVPWAERLEKEELEKAQREQEDEANAAEAVEPGATADVTPDATEESAQEFAEPEADAHSAAEGATKTSDTDTPSTQEPDIGQAQTVTARKSTRRPVRRRRTAQRTAARRRAAQRQRGNDS
ncbi:DUF3027 domain-containing protein [Glutamicibacter sp. PS]|uniref:DUF3027 domain-containing protein n=1 Tax=Glutamicibacter sp. PS TaxID=3075634 RepID=UPI00284A817C|nr:DUF3027 domain-containing protein [Glutamicibacter sp. PS]MDR4533837.1 DUF3027 domain-containing protein [Glutamicibacter sp. PS]